MAKTLAKMIWSIPLLALPSSSDFDFIFRKLFPSLDLSPSVLRFIYLFDLLYYGWGMDVGMHHNRFMAISTYIMAYIPVALVRALTKMWIILNRFWLCAGTKMCFSSAAGVVSSPAIGNWLWENCKALKNNI